MAGAPSLRTRARRQSASYPINPLTFLVMVCDGSLRTDPYYRRSRYGCFIAHGEVDGISSDDRPAEPERTRGFGGLVAVDVGAEKSRTRIMNHGHIRCGTVRVYPFE